MRLSKIMDYYGSKYAIAHLYGDAEECSIVEPFAGGMNLIDKVDGNRKLQRACIFALDTNRSKYR